MAIKRFSNFSEEYIPLEGNKVKIDSMLNQEVLVTGYNIKRSKYIKEDNDKCLTIQFEINDVKKIIFTGSNVLIEQIEKYKNEIPFIAIIKKIDRYYTFS